ncbi:MAG: putative integral membrane protein (TIGR00697 family) [Patiriisocius sp.]|jgi:uncharacterized integral membrane protein (TIGR00697 family)
MAKQKNGEFFYLILAAIFIASLVTCNLIFLKFTSFTPFSFLTFGATEDSIWHNLVNYTFIISVGLIPYPITFLVTDLISEIYGVRRANNVVKAGLMASVFVLIIVFVADISPSINTDPSEGVTDVMFSSIFGLTAVSVFSSMMAYLLAQFIDIRIFHFWKRRTNGKKLWLRNNFSTIPSQFFDSMTVLLMLCSFGAIPWENFWPFFWSGFIFKILVALFDTPLFYLFSGMARRYFGLKMGEELVDKYLINNY